MNIKPALPLLVAAILGVAVGSSLVSRGLDGFKGHPPQCVSPSGDMTLSSAAPLPPKADEPPAGQDLSSKTIPGGRDVSSPDIRLLEQLKTLKVTQEATQKRLAEYESQIEELETKLGYRRTRPEFDLTKEDWAELKQNNVMKFRLPCEHTWPTDDTLNRLGLSPEDREPILDAYSKSVERRWSLMVPMCAKALDVTVEVARRIGLDSCESIVMNYGYSHDDPIKSFQRIAGYHTGENPLPAPEEQTVFDKIALYFTGELPLFEADLASTFGPEQAHEMVFAKEMCLSNSTYQLNGKPEAP